MELRNREKRSSEEDSITFVHTYNPIYPNLLQKIKGLVSRLYTHLECLDAFGSTKIIGSSREPSNLLRLLQRSRFDESGSTANAKGVTKCKASQCKCCDDIIETDKVFFRNVGFYLRIGEKMDCTVRNVIYALFCNGCGQSYIGETVCFRDRVNSHRSNSKHENNAVMEVSKHLLDCDQGFKICPIVKVKEDCKILRLLVEDSLVKLLKPDLNAPRRNILHLKAMDELGTTQYG